MTEPATVKTRGYWNIPAWARIIASLFGICLAVIFTFFSVFYFLIIEDTPVLIAFFLVSLLLGVLLPWLPYGTPKRLLLIEAVVLLAWGVSSVLGTPPIVKIYRIEAASKIVPPYSAMQLKEIFYSQKSDLKDESAVLHIYNTNTPDNDFEKIYNYYKEYLIPRGWFESDFGPKRKVFINNNSYPRFVSIEIYNGTITVTHYFGG